MNAIETLRKYVSMRDTKYECSYGILIDWPAILAEVERLKAITDKLPKYADTGEPFVPSIDNSYAVAHKRVEDQLPARHEDVRGWLPMDADFHDGFVGWFSTYEAAKAAAKRKDDQ